MLTRRLLIASVSLSSLIAFAAGCSRGPSATEFITRGDQRVKEGKLPEAIIEFRNAVSKEPKSGLAHRKLADAYFATDDAARATGEYVRAADLLPMDDELQLKAGVLLVVAGRPNDGRARAEKVLARNPKNLDALILRGNAIAGLRDINGAIAEFNEAIRLNPSDALSYRTLGAMQLEKGNRAEALIAFKKAIEVEPKSVPAHLALANFYWQTGQLNEAEPSLKRAVQLEPRNASAVRTLATFYRSVGRFDDAEPLFKSLAERVHDVRSRIDLADFYGRQRKYAQARKALTPLLTERDGYVQAKLGLAQLDAEEGLPAEANRNIDEALLRDPKNVTALLLKAKLLLTEQRDAEALEKAKAAVAADPRSAIAYEVMGQVLTAMQDGPGAAAAFTETLKWNSRAFGPRLALAELRLSMNEGKEARRLADEILVMAPGYPQARSIQVRAAISDRNFYEADAKVKEILKDYPNEAWSHRLAAGVHLSKNEFTPARVEYDRALKINPRDVTALRGRVAADIQSNNLKDARALIANYLMASPKNRPLLLLAAGIEEAAGDQAALEKFLRRVLDADPNNAEAYSSLARLYAKQNKLDRAKAQYEALARRLPKSTTAQMMVGFILEMQNKAADATKIYEKVLQMSPRHPVASNNLAWHYAEAGGNLDLALQLAQTAVQQQPKDPDFNDTLGWIYYKKDLATLAIAPFEASVKARPKNPQYQYHLGLAYAKAGDADKARDSFNEALKQQPDFKEAQQARNALPASPASKKKSTGD